MGNRPDPLSPAESGVGGRGHSPLHLHFYLPLAVHGHASAPQRVIPVHCEQGAQRRGRTQLGYPQQLGLEYPVCRAVSPALVFIPIGPDCPGAQKNSNRTAPACFSQLGFSSDAVATL